MIISLKAINFSVAQFKLAGVDCLYTVKRFDFEKKLCYDLNAAFLYELDEAFKSTGLVYSQIDTVFAFGEAKDNHKIGEILQRLFPNKVQFEQTDAEQRNSAIMEKWRMYEQLAAAERFSDSKWKCSTFVWNNKCVELRCPKPFKDLQLTECK